MYSVVKMVSCDSGNKGLWSDRLPLPTIGSEYQAVVEYAPSQKVPAQKSKPRVDARQGQIDKGMMA